MSKKKIVSIEDRIPKLKEQRKKKTNRRLVTYLTIFFVLILMIVYLTTPLSDIKTINVSGLVQTEETEVVKTSGLSTDTNIWSFDKEKIADELTKSPQIKSAQVKRRLPSTVSIHIDEYERIGYLHSNDAYYPLLETGNTLKDNVDKQPEGDAPLLINFDDEENIQEMSRQLKQLPESIRHLISEIHWIPESGNPYKIMLYMVDGFMVEGTTRHFAERMSAYPSIVSQLDPKEKGIVHIGAGAYFESFKSEKDQTEAEETTP